MKIMMMTMIITIMKEWMDENKGNKKKGYGLSLGLAFWLLGGGKGRKKKTTWVL